MAEDVAADTPVASYRMEDARAWFKQTRRADFAGGGQVEADYAITYLADAAIEVCRIYEAEGSMALSVPETASHPNEAAIQACRAAIAAAEAFSDRFNTSRDTAMRGFRRDWEFWEQHGWFEKKWDDGLGLPIGPSNLKPMWGSESPPEWWPPGPIVVAGGTLEALLSDSRFDPEGSVPFVVSWLFQDGVDVHRQIIEAMKTILGRWAAMQAAPPVFVVAAREIQPRIAHELIEAGATIMTEDLIGPCAVSSPEALREILTSIARDSSFVRNRFMPGDTYYRPLAISEIDQGPIPHFTQRPILSSDEDRAVNAGIMERFNSRIKSPIEW
ncbi:MAG: hypothetical protein WAS21_27335 [Geminicoccaceae bacterium]